MVFMFDRPIEAYLTGRFKSTNRSSTEEAKLRMEPRRATLVPNSSSNPMTLFSEGNDPSSPILKKRKSVEHQINFDISREKKDSIY